MSTKAKPLLVEQGLCTSALESRYSAAHIKLSYLTCYQATSKYSTSIEYCLAKVTFYSLTLYQKGRRKCR